MNNAKISRLRIYPVKSLGPVDVEEAIIARHSLQNDRRFAMIDEDGRYVNGKRTARVNELKAEYDLTSELISLHSINNPERRSFKLAEGNAELDNYLSEFFDVKLQVVENAGGEFLDIPVQSSVTIVSEASLKSLQTDIEAHSLENIRLRFRSNIELTGVEAFWEEQLYQEPGVGVRFMLGEVEMIGISPRARCNVPPQNPATGEFEATFAKQMIASRMNSLPDDATLLEYGRVPYFLTVNVFVPGTEVGKRIKLNDKIEIVEPVKLSA